MPVQVRPEPGAITWRIRLLSNAPPLRTTPTWPPVVLSKPEKSATAVASRITATTNNPPIHSPTRPAERPDNAAEGLIRLFSLCIHPSDHPRSTIAAQRRPLTAILGSAAESCVQGLVGPPLPAFRGPASVRRCQKR